MFGTSAVRLLSHRDVRRAIYQLQKGCIGAMGHHLMANKVCRLRRLNSLNASEVNRCSKHIKSGNCRERQSKVFYLKPKRHPDLCTISRPPLLRFATKYELESLRLE